MAIKINLPLAPKEYIASAYDDILRILRLAFNQIQAATIDFFAFGTGAIGRSVQDKLREFISVEDFGAVGDGVADDTTAFTNAVTSLGTEGGTVRFNGKHLIDNNLTVPANVTLKGPMTLIGTPANNASTPYGNLAALIINSTKTITLMGGAGLDGCLVYRKGMTFPASDSSAFAGTAITGGNDDYFVINSMILGFAQGVTSSGKQRPRLQNVWHDNLSGFLIDNCADVSHIRNCHAWPFSTIAAGGPATSLQRSGNAYKFTTLGDWNKVADCFSYGYFRGFWVSSCNSMTLFSCSTDSTTGFAGQIGFVVDGGSTDTRLVVCQAAAQETGYYINTSANIQTRMIGCDAWFNANHGVLIDGGDLAIVGGINRNTANAITVNNANSKVTLDGSTKFDVISGSKFNINVATSFLWIGEYNATSATNGSSLVGGAAALTSQSIASADPLNLPVTGEFFTVTGATNFGTLNSGWAGRKVTLFFTGAPTVFNGAGVQGMRLNGAVNFVAAAGSTLTLGYNGTQWYEIGRSA